MLGTPGLAGQLAHALLVLARPQRSDCEPAQPVDEYSFCGRLADGTFCLFTHRPWDFAVNNPRITLLCWLTLCLQAVRMTVRVMCASRIFGLHFAFGVPLRSFLANLINCCASLSAIWRYVHARFEGRTLIWLKTDHAYPVRELLAVPRRDFAEVLLSGGFMSNEKLAFIVAGMPEGADLAEYLFANGMLTDEDLCRALEHARRHSLRSHRGKQSQAAGGPQPSRASGKTPRGGGRRHFVGPSDRGGTARSDGGSLGRVERFYVAVSGVSAGYSEHLRGVAQASLAPHHHGNLVIIGWRARIRGWCYDAHRADNHIGVGGWYSA